MGKIYSDVECKGEWLCDDDAEDNGSNSSMKVQAPGRRSEWHVLRRLSVAADPSDPSAILRRSVKKIGDNQDNQVR